MLQEPEDLWIDNVRIGSTNSEPMIQIEKDDFKEDADVILQLNGLSQNFKRSAKRQVHKALITAGGEIVTAEDTL